MIKETDIKPKVHKDYNEQVFCFFKRGTVCKTSS